jgi:hypothetical protein
MAVSPRIADITYDLAVFVNVELLIEYQMPPASAVSGRELRALIQA